MQSPSMIPTQKQRTTITKLSIWFNSSKYHTSEQLSEPQDADCTKSFSVLVN
uniref:Uncharacterized protein LOC107624056 n=1 Tax=Rhizophora mucronata TaxID=61149 RepID=A0A2P2J964_RHIMU